MKSAKAYLKQISILKHRIWTKRDQLEELRGGRLSAVTYDSDVVQTSPTGEPEFVRKIIENEEEIEQIANECVEMIKKYTLLKNEIINQIHELNDDRYERILTLRYIYDRTLEEIAVEMSYNFDHIRHMHGYALAEFEKIHMR